MNETIMTDHLPNQLNALRDFSARVGSDPLLTQAAGGNTSLKEGYTLWIKASGTWLAHARERDIMVPVHMAPLVEAVERSDPRAEQAECFTVAERNPSGLRPSIETTVHALMPQPVVAHVHCVDTIALAVRKDARVAFQEKLAGLNWAFVPYHRPGLPLARGIAEHRGRRPDVLVLGNHGLVVAGESVKEAEALLSRVKGLVRQDARRAPPPDVPGLLERAGGGYRLPADLAAHAVATDTSSAAIAAGGSLYPDHVVFLGVGSVLARAGESADDVVGRSASPPAMILFPGLGVLMRQDASAGADAMARCLADVAARVPVDAPLEYLDARQNDELINWDAEKYRQSLGARAAAADGGH